MEKKKIILITGMSGSGKSTAMGILEDMGYHIIDQYPVQLLSDLYELIKTSDDPRYQYVALATNILEFNEFISVFTSEVFDTRVLILNSSEDVLLRRYKQTRRTHPLLISSKARTLEEAIDLEKEYFMSVSEKAFLSVDTTFLSNSELKITLANYFSLEGKPVFSISFISFGFKKGLPMDADLVFDVRFLPNPYWEETLRSKTGLEEEVYTYVMEKQQTKECIEKLEDFLNYSLKQYVLEGKNHLTVAIGCTGGKHRSVSIARWLYQAYSKQCRCFLNHRDVGDYL